MLTPTQIERFTALRARLFGAIALYFADEENGGHCKSYEGHFSIGFPNYFEETNGDKCGAWSVGLDCYVIGPSRHYTWTGATFDEALAAAEAEIGGWL